MTATVQPTRTAPQLGVDVPAPGVYVLDPAHTHVGFSVRHLMVARVRGRFAAFGGTVTIADDPLDSTVEVTVETASIDTRNADRDAHLRSPDFFAVDEHPAMTFRSTAVEHLGGDDYRVDGNLEIRGASRPVSLTVTFEGAVPDPSGSGGRLGFTARAEIDREHWGLTWNQALETGGVLVGRTVTLDIEAEAAGAG